MNTKIFLNYLKNQKNYSPNTIINYELDIIKYQQYLEINHLNFQNISYQEITSYLGYLKQIGLSNSSISRNTSAIRSLYNYYVRNKIVNNNPFKLITGIKRERKLPNFLQYNEFEDIVKNCGEDELGIRNRALLELLIASGLRVGEITKIEINNIDFKDQSIRIIGKGNKERIVYYGEYAKDSIENYLKNSRDKLLGKKESNHLFINHLGDPLTTRGVADVINRIISKTAIEKKISPHTFRHSFATMLINEGANSKMVQELLGHSSIGTTSIYTHLSDTKLRMEYIRAHPRARK